MYRIGGNCRNRKYRRGCRCYRNRRAGRSVLDVDLSTSWNVYKVFKVTLAVHFHETNAEGDRVGGPMYYIKNGLKKHWHWLAYLFAAFGVLTVFGTGNATQVNTITTAIDSALFNYGIIEKDSVGTLNLIIGIVLAILIGMILLGGIKRIGHVTEKLVPFMAAIYVILALGVVVLNFQNIPSVFGSIFEGAFSPASVTGGAVGSFFMSMKKGVSRGIFSNEAVLVQGLLHMHVLIQKTCETGIFGIFEVFVDTIVICTLTALVILCSGVPVGYGEAAGAELTILGLHPLMETGYQYLQLLQCAASHFPQLSDGDCTERDVWNFFCEQKRISHSWYSMHSLQL